MDRGRQIDNIQNTNARYIDQFGKSGRTSTKIITIMILEKKIDELKKI